MGRALIYFYIGPLCVCVYFNIHTIGYIYYTTLTPKDHKLLGFMETVILTAPVLPLPTPHPPSLHIFRY